jgi:type 1 glutamine amidotransferase
MLLFVWWAGAASPADSAKLKVLVVTGGHGFQRDGFFKVFSENPDITFTEAKQGKTSEAYDREDLLTHDAIVLYDMVQNITDAQKAKFLALFEKGVGLVVMHHALVSYQGWPEFERIIGGTYPEPQDRKGKVTPELGYEHDVQVPVQIVAKNHPVTAGLGDFTIHDEIYWGFRTRADVTPLLTTTHPKSGKPLMWTRREKKSRVIYLQLGHGPEAFANPNYRKLVAQSIQFVANQKTGGRKSGQ